MCISKFHEDKCSKMSRNEIGRTISDVLGLANRERRLICGLVPAITYLEQNPDEVLVCLLPETRPGDVTAHMHVVLLQAFCYENDIPVLMVDSSKRLAELCGTTSSCPCAIVTHDPNISWEEDKDPPLTPEEKTLQDFYECSLEQCPRPVIELPI